MTSNYLCWKVFNSKTQVIIRTLLLLIFICQNVKSEGCAGGYITFELVTGFVYTAPSDTMKLLPGTLQLTECLSSCRKNSSCQSVNFETGLCVLFSSSATERPGALTSSQFPVFTIYAQKLCLLGSQRCDREWLFERVSGYELRELSRKRYDQVPSKESCMEICLSEREFLCRSAKYDPVTSQCALSDRDRYTAAGSRHFGPADSPSAQYLESNCVDEPVRLCEFKKVSGKILKTVDAVFQDVTTLEECRRKCLTVKYRCHSFDFSDPANSVCRLSHHASASLTHIQDPYLDIPGATTYELASCYNVTIQCRAREMVANVKTSKTFNGKVYAKSRPNSCVTDVVNSLEFEIRMAYNDLNCDVKQESFGQFSNDIVIQHHDMVVTNQDLGLSVHCQYDLSNRSVSNGVQLEVNGEVDTSGTQSAVVSSPNVTMRIADRSGADIQAAQVGDPLALRFEIMDPGSPYEIFVRELVAMDGIDNSEILLIDEIGCPTDTAIMGPLTKVNGSGRILHAPFEAFKFPTSEIVQFKALVTPCLPNCEPARCAVRSFDGNRRDLQSLGRRRRDAIRDKKYGRSSGSDQEDLVVVHSIHISDKFGFGRSERKLWNDEDNEDTVNKPSSVQEMVESSGCVNLIGLIVACTLFLAAQLVILITWACLWQRRRRGKAETPEDSSRSSVDMLYATIREIELREQHYAHQEAANKHFDYAHSIPRGRLTDEPCFLN